MITTNKINAYLHQNGEYRIDAVQGDTARVLELSLYAGAEEWPVPEGTAVQIRYRKPDGTGGYYDTLPGGTCAYRIQGNAVTCALAPQVLTVAGTVEAQVLLCWDGGELATFSVLIQVQADPSLGTLESEDYVNLSDWVANRVKSYLEESQEELRELFAIPGAFFVHVFRSSDSDTGYVADKTYEEILAAGPNLLTSLDGGLPVFCVLWRPSGREYAVLSLAAHDSLDQRLTFSRMEGNGEYWVTINGSGNVGAGWVQMAQKSDVPERLPNPEALIINGTAYDGSEAVTVTGPMPPMVVTGEFNAVTNYPLDVMYTAYQLGRTVIFNWSNRLLTTLVADQGGWMFSAIEGGYEMLVALELDADGNTVVTTKRMWALARQSDLPDPQPLTINGQSYDGSTAVEITVPKEKTYRQIERRELIEGTETSVTFSDLQLTAFRAYLSIPVGTAASVGAAAYIGSTLAGYSWLASMISATSDRVAMVEGRIEGGLAVCGNTTPANATQNTCTFLRSPKCVEATGPFTKLEFGASSGVAFPAGTVIELWGVES